MQFEEKSKPKVIGGAKRISSWGSQQGRRSLPLPHDKGPCLEAEKKRPSAVAIGGGLRSHQEGGEGKKSNKKKGGEEKRGKPYKEL